MYKLLRIPLLDCFMILICIFPITTVLDVGGIINKMLFVLLFAVQIYLLFTRRMKGDTALLTVWLVVHYVFVIINTSFPITNSNLLFYFPFFLVYTYFVRDNTEAVMAGIERNMGFIQVVVNMWTVLVGVSILVPSCYYASKDGNVYFGSWCDTIFRLGPSAVFIQILAIILQVSTKRKYAIVYMIVPMYCMLMGSSRTYLVIGVCLFVISWYFFCRSKQLFWFTIIPMGILSLFLIMSTAIGDKILYTLDENNYGDFWFRITSSRSVLWAESLKKWNQLPVLNKLLGRDIDFCNKVSGRWAHNDFIEILCSFGVVGAIQYIAAMSSMLKKSWKGICLPWVIKTSVIVIWLFNAFFNMHYVYFCAMLSYPFLVLALRSVSGKRTEEISQYIK